MLIIQCPNTYQEERRYIFGVLFGDFLGMGFRIEFQHRTDVRVTCSQSEQHGELFFTDCLFHIPAHQWLSVSALPSQPLQKLAYTDWPTGASWIDSPILYGESMKDGAYVVRIEHGYRCGVDIFGSSFFMLTRYEEIVKTERDSRGRFPAHASIAFQEGFLLRPVVNEYLELLWALLHDVWPHLQRKKRAYRLLLSHDVDWPLGVAFRPIMRIVKTTIGDMVVRKSIKLAVRRVYSYVQVRRGHLECDLLNTFDDIMSYSESLGLRSSFYFIADHPAGDLDGVYDIASPFIRQLMVTMAKRGHEVGLHTSYLSFCSKEQIALELTKLRVVARQMGLSQSSFGGRQHYLRFAVPATWQAWEDNGLTYDSTLSYADHPGFRCGVCYEYPVFNLLTKKALQLRERPLIVMECSLLSNRYLGYSHSKSKAMICQLAQQCRQYHGDFTLLWHNNMLVQKADIDLYKTVVKECMATVDENVAFFRESGEIHARTM